MDHVVFQEKLRRPEPLGLSRARLERRLLADDGPAVMLVLAPPGSGKTTLLAHVAADHATPTAWYRAGPEDADEQHLVRHLAEALARAAAVAPSRAATFEALIAETEQIREPLRLIIDDVHELASTPAELTLERFVRLRPRTVRLVLGSRRPLAFNTPRLVVSGDLVELDGDALRFRSWEVEELFRSVYKEPLPPEAAAALTQRTGGWAAGLQLFHLATRGKPVAARAHAVMELGGRSRLLRSYLTRNVLDELEPDRREFLLVTSTLGTLTGELCDALLGLTGSAAVLEDLERAQFFTTSNDDGRTYRYHQVLQTLLEGLLIEDRGLRRTRALHARSAALLEQAGFRREAVRAYALADDWGSVGRMLQSSTTGIPVDVELWSGGVALPVDDPWLTLGRARRLLRSGAVDAAVRAYRQAEALWDDADFRAVCSAERSTAAVWTAADFSSTPQSSGPLDGTRRIVEAIRRATRRLPDLADTADARIPPLADGVIRLLAGRFSEVSEILTPVWTDHERDACERLCAGLAVVVGNLAGSMFAGARSPDVESVLEDIVLTAEVEEQPWIARVARGMQACVVRTSRSGRAGSPATTGLQALVQECEHDGDRWGAVLLGIVVGVTQLRSGADEAAENALQRSASSAAALEAPVLSLWALALAVVAARRLNRPDLAHRVTEVEGLVRGTGAALPPRLGEGIAAVAFDASTVERSTPVDQPVQTAGGRRPSWEVRCLGGFTVWRNGECVALPALRPRARSLLLVLAIHHRRDFHCERLIDLLWPDAPLPAGKHRLQVAASSVRRFLSDLGLGDDPVQRHGGAYRLDLDPGVVDVQTLDEALSAGQHAAASGELDKALAYWDVALETYRGELLPEAGPAEWVVGERERLRVATATGALEAARLRRGSGRTVAAQHCARRAVELDPWSDSAWQLLAEIQDELGDRTAAAATRVRHAEVRSQLV